MYTLYVCCVHLPLVSPPLLPHRDPKTKAQVRPIAAGWRGLWSSLVVGCSGINHSRTWIQSRFKLYHFCTSNSTSKAFSKSISCVPDKDRSGHRCECTGHYVSLTKTHKGQKKGARKQQKLSIKAVYLFRRRQSPICRIKSITDVPPMRRVEK